MNASETRAAFNVIKRAYTAKGRNPVLTPSTLRLQVPIVASRTTYTFPILEGDAQTSFTEAVYLNRTDAFTALEMGLFIGDNAGSAANVAYDLYSYQSEALTTAGITNSKALFNQGLIDISINNVNYLQNFDCRRMAFTPIIQAGNIFATGGDTTVQMQQDENAGFAALTPTLQFSGTAKTQITLKLPAALAATSGVLVLMFRGFLALNASNLNK